MVIMHLEYALHKISKQPPSDTLIQLYDRIILIPQMPHLYFTLLYNQIILHMQRIVQILFFLHYKTKFKDENLLRKIPITRLSLSKSSMNSNNLICQSRLSHTFFSLLTLKIQTFSLRHLLN